jgi:hypothetical protein
MLRVGIVAEGPSDWLVLEEVMKTVHPDIEFVRLQPNQTLFAGIGQGWKGVRAWCQKNGQRLGLIMQGLIDRPIQILVIHADCSMADEEGADRPCPPASETAGALKRVIEQSWLNLDPFPEFVVLATPAMSSDAWVIAAFEQPIPNLALIECDKAIEDEFVRRRIFRKREQVRMRKGRKIKEFQVKKNTEIYGPMAVRCGQVIDQVCAHCPQAEAFRINFQAAVARSSPPSAP